MPKAKDKSKWQSLAQKKQKARVEFFKDAEKANKQMGRFKSYSEEKPRALYGHSGKQLTSIQKEEFDKPAKERGEFRTRTGKNPPLRPKVKVHIGKDKYSGDTTYTEVTIDAWNRRNKK